MAMQSNLTSKSRGAAPHADYFLCTAKESNQRNAAPVCRRYAVPCVARLVRRLRNSHDPLRGHVLKQSSPTTPDQPALLGGAQGRKPKTSNSYGGQQAAHHTKAYRQKNRLGCIGTMKKTKQHYVWRYYLKSWTSNGSIWCNRKGKVFPSDLMNVGQERYFYKLKELTQKDIEFVRKIAIDPTKHELLRKLNEDWLNIFNFIFKLKSIVKENDTNKYELDELIDKAIHNLEEDYHQSIEGNAIKHIDLILAKDISFFQTEKERIEFAYFLCVQYMRTKKRQEAICNQFKNQNNSYLEDVNIVDPDFQTIN